MSFSAYMHPQCHIPSSQGSAPRWLYLSLRLGLPEPATGWLFFDLGLVAEDKPTEFSCVNTPTPKIQFHFQLLSNIPTRTRFYFDGYIMEHNSNFYLYLSQIKFPFQCSHSFQLAVGFAILIQLTET